MVLQIEVDSTELVNKYFEVNPTTVLGLLVGGLVVVILYLVYENRQLKNKINELTDKLIELTTTLIEKLSDIKSGIEIHSNDVATKINGLIAWVKNTLKPKTVRKPKT